MRDETTADIAAEVGASFHAGEVALQREAGVAERMSRLGQQVVRRLLPEQHRQFFPQLPFLIVGSLDARGQPSASLLAGPPASCASMRCPIRAVASPPTCAPARRSGCSGSRHTRGAATA